MEDVRTLGRARDATGARRGRDLRRVGLVAFGIVVVLAATGVLGPRTVTQEATGGGYRLVVTHVTVVRSSNIAPLHVQLERTGGFGDDPVRLRIGAGLFDHLDFQNWYPNPSAETAGDGVVVYEFDPPPADVFTLALDARTGPNQWFSRGTYGVEVLDGGDVPVRVDVQLQVLP